MTRDGIDTLFPGVEGATREEWAVVAANRGLVGMVVGWTKHWESEDERDDAFQDGCFGLLRAVQKFDPDRGFQLSTYAVPWIRQAIHRGRMYRGDINQRRSDRTGVGWEAPLSIDAANDDGSSFAELVKDAADVAAEVEACAELANVCTALRLACGGDERNRAVVEAMIDGSSMSSVARRFGTSTQEMSRRARRLRSLARSAVAS